jgi:hypothetical protein
VALRRPARVSALAAAVCAGALAGALFGGAAPVTGQDRANRGRRTADGKPDFNGIWQAMNTANWDIQDHDQRQGPLFQLGAAFSVPAGEGVVVGNEIPYRPEALAKKNANGKDWLKLDPEIKCYLPGIPRATYMPYPFQIVESSNTILFAYAYANASRIVPLNAELTTPIDTWMGYPSGRWDGDTLVIDSKGFNDETWFDRAGNYHSDALHVIERYTAAGPDALRYEVTIDDPKVFTRSWQMRMPLYRRLEDPPHLLKYHCIEFAEEVLYGRLRRTPKNER